MSENNPHRESMQMLNVTLSLSGVSVLLLSVGNALYCIFFYFPGFRPICMVVKLHAKIFACIFVIS